MVKALETYIDNLQFESGYNRYITVEHRNNNPKRDYLFVNLHQCKHIPSKPWQMELMCKDLAKKVTDTISEDEKVLVIGFAETATAIGNFVADNIQQCEYVMKTTRENVANSKQLITFEEEHSHATTQLLLTHNDIDPDKLMESFSYILFVEDEISTGNTILNFIKAFNAKFNNNLRFGVASICNWQNEENKKLFSRYNIDRFYLLSGSLKDSSMKMDLDSSLIIEISDDTLGSKSISALNFSESKNFENERLGYKKSEHNYDFSNIVEECKGYSSIRIIGSEECMYPAIKLGRCFEELGIDVICHSTTRSKIDSINIPYVGEDKMIKNGHNVESAYDKNRKTFIYNTEEYTELIIIISDTKDKEQFRRFAESVASVCNTNSKIVGYQI